MENLVQKIKNWYKALPNKKIIIEVIAATLSVPMMVTAILVNINNINNQKLKNLAATTPPPIQVIIDNPNSTPSSDLSTITPIAAKNAPTTTPTAVPTKTECKKDIGPISILSPQESEIITTDKVPITISTDASYCPVTWSYRLGTDNWSDFSSNNIYLYNLTPGRKQIQIKVKNTAGDKTITLERNFIYQTSTTTPAASPSATSTQ